MISITNKNEILRTAIFDLVSIVLILFVPTISHVTGFPFYVFEPMRLIIIPFVLFSRIKNAYFLAIALPLFSFLIAGHPGLYKMPLVSIDLILNILFFSILINRKLNLFLSLISSIVISKAIYYLLKATFIYFGLLENGLVETNFIYQFGSLFVIIIIAFIFRNKLKNQY